MRSGVRVDAPTGLYDRGRRPIPRVLGGHLSKGLAATREGSFKLTFAALVVAAAVVATVHPSRQNVSTVELAVVLALGMAVSGGLLLGAQLIALRSKPAANAALAMVTLACVFTAYVVHTELFYPGNRLALAAICGAALFGLFVAFQVIDERRWGGVVLSAVALVAVSSPLWPDMAVGLGEPGGVLSLNEPRFWIALIGCMRRRGARRVRGLSGRGRISLGSSRPPGGAGGRRRRGHLDGPRGGEAICRGQLGEAQRGSPHRVRRNAERVLRRVRLDSPREHHAEVSRRRHDRLPFDVR